MTFEIDCPVEHADCVACLPAALSDDHQQGSMLPMSSNKPLPDVEQQAVVLACLDGANGNEMRSVELLWNDLGRDWRTGDPRRNGRRHSQIVGCRESRKFIDGRLRVANEPVGASKGVLHAPLVPDLLTRPAIFRVP